MMKNGVQLKKIIKALAVVFAIGYIFSFSRVQAATTIGANISTDGYLKIGTAVPGAPENGMIYYDSGNNKFKCYQGGVWFDCIGTISGILPVSSGGTGYNSYASGDLLYGNVGGTLSILGLGSDGDFLTVSSGALTWQAYDPLVITNTFPVASEVAMLAAGALKGDVAIRSDESKSYICTTDPCTVLGNWTELVAPTNLALLKSNNLSDLTNFADARDNLNLGVSDTPGFLGLDFTTVTNPAPSEGILFYDQGLSSLSYYNDQIKVDIGQKNILRVENPVIGGVPISYGQIVYISGAGTGGIPTVGLAMANAVSTSKVLGFAAQNIAVGSQGYITAYGMLTGLSTGSYSDGDPLYLSATEAGGMTATKPIQPNYEVPVGYIGDAAASGTVLVFVVPKLSTIVNTGGISYGNAAGYLVDDVANLFWDDINKRLGIGTNVPAYTLDVAGDIKTGNGSLFYLGTNVGAPAGTPANGSMYYDTGSNKFKCYVNSAWVDCDTTGGTTTLQTAYNSGATITTAGSTDIAYTLTSGNLTASGAGSVNLTPTSASSFTSGGALTLTAGAGSTWSSSSGALTITSAAAATWGTSSGDLILQVAGTGTTAKVQIGSGGVGSITPDILGLDVKSTAGDPAGFNGAMYYNENSDRFRCYENSAWKDCDASVVASFQTAYDNGGAVTTSGTNPIAFTLTSGDFTATGAGSVNLTPTGASSFTSADVLTLTGGAASTWSTGTGALTITSAAATTWSTASGALNITGAGALALQGGAASSLSTTVGNITIQPGGTGTTANVQIGDGGATSATPDMLVLDIGSADPAGTNGAMYYSTATNSFRCYVNGSWGSCDTTGGTATLQSAYNAGATITTAGSTDIAYILTAGNFTASGAGSVNLTPTGASSFTSASALTLTGGAASTWGTSAGDLQLQAAGSGTAANIKIGVGGAGSTTPDLFALDVKSTTGDPVGGYDGAMYYNKFDNLFRCYEAGGWQNCGSSAASATTLQQSYIAGPTITTVGAQDVALILTSGNFTASGAGSVDLTPTGASSFTSGAALTLTGGAASIWGTSAGNLTLQAAGAGTTANVQIGAGGAGSTTPDFFALDVKSTTGDPAGGAEGYIYYNTFDNKFRCYENTAWKDCDTGGMLSLQGAYDGGATITTSGSTDLALTLTSGNFTASGAGSVNLTPTGDSSFTSAGALTLTGGAASTWGTSAGALTLQAAGAGTTSSIQIGIGGGGSTTPDLLALDVKSDAGDPAGSNGKMYYNANTNRFRCYENGAWVDCGSNAPSTTSLQDAYANGATITTIGATNIAFTLTSGNFTASGAGSVSLTPTAASSFTSGGALTLTGGATSTWGTSSGNLNLQVAGAGTTANVQIGSGAGSGTPDLLVADIKNTAGDPAGTAGAMYYNSSEGKFKCYEAGTWKDCDTAGTSSLQTSYNSGATIITSGGNAITFTTPNVPASNNAGLVINQDNTTNNPVTLVLNNKGTGNFITATDGGVIPTTIWSVTKGGVISTPGNINATGTGAITSAGILTALNGLTMSTGALSLTSTSGSISSTGLTGLTLTLASGTGAITAPTLNLNTTGTGNTAIGNATGTFALNSSALDITTGGVMTGGTWQGTAIGATYGGTAQTTYATGDMLYASAINTLGKLTVGTNGQCLTSNGTTPVWGACGTGLTNPMTTLGDIIYGGASGTPTRLATGTAGQVLQTNGASAPTWVTMGTSYQATPPDPTGTANTTGVMMGLAGSITPIRSGKIMIVISGDIKTNTNGAGGQLQIRYGTGAAPANGVALTGTAAGGLQKFYGQSNSAVVRVPFSVNSIVSGLTLNTAVWLDLSLAALVGGTANIYDVSVSVYEL